MQQKSFARSPYLSAHKTKDCSFFPRIRRGENRPNKGLPKSLAKNHYHQSIFKLKEEGCEKQKAIQFKIVDHSPERVYQSKQYRDLEAKMLEAEAHHKRELAELEQKRTAALARIEQIKKTNFQAKYDFWMLKNEIMGLEAAVAEEEDENSRLLHFLGYNVDPESAVGDFSEHLSVNQDQSNQQ